MLRTETCAGWPAHRKGGGGEVGADNWEKLCRFVYRRGYKRKAEEAGRSRQSGKMSSRLHPLIPLLQWCARRWRRKRVASSPRFAPLHLLAACFPPNPPQHLGKRRSLRQMWRSQRLRETGALRPLQRSAHGSGRVLRRGVDGATPVRPLMAACVACPARRPH
eukprot:scaffold325300_cov66-Tisochrysis_lutea.AAC.1